MERRFTIEEAVDKLRISRATLYRHLKSGEINAVKSGNKTLLMQAEIDRFMRSAPLWKPVSGPSAKPSQTSPETLRDTTRAALPEEVIQQALQQFADRPYTEDDYRSAEEMFFKRR